MFDELGDFDEAFSNRSPADAGASPALPLRRLKTLKQRCLFWATNLVVLPLVALCYLTIGAEGLRQMMSVFSLKLYKLPIPGAGFLERYDGWDRLDIGMLFALVLFGAVTFIWMRLFVELFGCGHLAQQRESNPVLFFLLVAIALVVVLGDCAIFYLGLQSRSASGWGESSENVPLAAAIVYMAGLALLGAWHADYHCSGIV